MAGRVFFFLQHATYEPAFQAASMGITAAAMGDEVYFVFAFDALRQLIRGSFGRWARSWSPVTPRCASAASSHRNWKAHWMTSWGWPRSGA